MPCSKSIAGRSGLPRTRTRVRRPWTSMMLGVLMHARVMRDVMAFKSHPHQLWGLVGHYALVQVTRDWLPVSPASPRHSSSSNAAATAMKLSDNGRGNNRSAAATFRTTVLRWVCSLSAALTLLHLSEIQVRIVLIVS